MFLVALAFAAFAASALAGSYAVNASFVLTGSLANTDPVVTNPWDSTNRNTCSGGGASFVRRMGSFHYDVYHFQSLRGWTSGGVLTGVSTCVNVGLLVQSGTAVAAGYPTNFDPNNPPAPLFGGSTGGLGAGQRSDFEYVSNTTGATFDIVVYEAIQNSSATYTLLVEGTGIVMVGGGPTATASLQSFRASAAPKGVTVRWRTRSETNALGFNLYRGAARKVRLTRSIVRASGDGRGHTYSYIDRTARKGKAAPYYLEVVQRSGSKIMFGPAQAAR